jgi:hypothetical protein
VKKARIAPPERRMAAAPGCFLALVGSGVHMPRSTNEPRRTAMLTLILSLLAPNTGRFIWTPATRAGAATDPRLMVSWT